MLPICFLQLYSLQRSSYNHFAGKWEYNITDMIWQSGVFSGHEQRQITNLYWVQIMFVSVACKCHNICCWYPRAIRCAWSCPCVSISGQPYWPTHVWIKMSLKLKLRLCLLLLCSTQSRSCAYVNWTYTILNLMLLLSVNHWFKLCISL